MTLPSIDVRRDFRKIAGTLLALLLANGVFYGLFVYPRVAETAKLEAERDSFHSDLRAARKRTEALKEAHQRVLEQEVELDRFYNEVLGTKNTKMVGAQREINKICQEFGIEPREAGFQDEQQNEGRVERFSIILPLEGGYSNLRRFIERVEKSDNFFVIDRVSLAGTREGGTELKLNVDVATYFDAPWLEDPRNRSGSARGRRRT